MNGSGPFANVAIKNPYVNVPDYDYDDEEAMFSLPPTRRDFGARLVRLALAKYLSLVLLSPFEVAQILLQVQHVPVSRLAASDEEDDVDEVRNFADVNANEDVGEEEEEEGDEDDADYDSFQRRYNDAEFRASPVRLDENRLSKPLATDSSGYINVDAARPLYEIQPPMSGGVWNAIKRIIRHRPEGAGSLFKGINTYFVAQMVQSLCRSAVEDWLNDQFDLYDSALIPLIHQESYVPNLLTIIASHVVVDGLMTSPLDIVRTRMIAQSDYPSQRRYDNGLRCLWDLATSDSSFGQQKDVDETVLPAVSRSWSSRAQSVASRLYPNMRFTLLYSTIVPLLQYSTPLIIHRYLRLTQASSPLYYGVAHFSLATLELLIRLPLETIRRRMHLQPALAKTHSSPHNVDALGRASHTNENLRACLGAALHIATGLCPAYHS